MSRAATTNHLVLSILCCAALGLSACSQRAAAPATGEPPPAAPPSATPAGPQAPSSSVAVPENTWWEPVDSAIGVPACDGYFERFAACKRMPPFATAQIRRTIAEWRHRLQTGGDKARVGLEATCSHSAPLWERSLTDVGC